MQSFPGLAASCCVLATVTINASTIGGATCQCQKCTQRVLADCERQHTCSTPADGQLNNTTERMSCWSQAEHMSTLSLCFAAPRERQQITIALYRVAGARRLQSRGGVPGRDAYAGHVRRRCRCHSCNTAVNSRSILMRVALDRMQTCLLALGGNAVAE